MPPQSPTTCPNCGASIPPRTPACPVCGSDHETGWSEGVYMDGIDTGESFDYSETLARELPGKSHKSRWRLLLTWQAAVAAVLLLLFVLGTLKGLLG